MGTYNRSTTADLMTCYWEVKIEAFTGVRLEIGVATRQSIYQGGLDKKEVRCDGLHLLRADRA